MLAKIQKWGNSLGVRLPKNLIKSTNLSANSYVDITAIDNNILIKPKNDPLDILLDQITDDNLHSIIFDCENEKGKEQW